MKYLGIDYGEKRIGLATSDDGGRVAFPLKTILNNEKVFLEIGEVIKEKQLTGMVVGESLNYKGEKNFIMDEIKNFVGRLKLEFGLAVFYEPEFLSSVQALKMGSEKENVDSGAATVILQAYLDKQQNKTEKNIAVIDYEDFAKLDMRIGKILTAKKIENADKLLLLSVDFGEEKPRQVVSGIAEYFKEGEGLAGVNCFFVTNLKTRRIRGYESEAMILAIKNGEELALLTPSVNVPIGSKAN